MDAYFAADLFAFASQVECSPLVLYEAAAAGLPAVTVPVGNSRRSSSRTGGGVVVSAGRRRDGDTDPDPATLASGMMELLDQPRRLREMGDHARGVWEDEFTWSVVAARYEALYAQLVAAR